MKDLEEHALNNTRYLPKLWVPYVDDTFVVWPYGREKPNDSLDYVNNMQLETLQRNLKFKTNYTFLTHLAES